MRAFVHTTDQDWFELLAGLAERGSLDEVNFWTPKPWGGQFRALNRGEPLLFKLKKPYNVIAGGGFFEHYSELPLSLAWDAFAEKNGVATLGALRDRISRLRNQPLAPWVDDAIGCILLVEPFFWPRNLWIPQPPDWSRNIVRGKRYDLTQGIGRRLWDEVTIRLESARQPEGHEGEGDGRGSQLTPARPLPGGYGDPLLQPRRVGQGTFRAVITDVYGRRGAITREKALPVLEAAHIKAFHVEPVHYVQNGILLRSDVHRLFDKGYLTITPSYRVEVSRRLHEDFDDGENYQIYHGAAVTVPADPELRPSSDNLQWHNDNVYRG